MLVLFGSHGSPGTTTTAFLTAYFFSTRPNVEKTLLVEADPSGGTLPTMLGLNAHSGLVSLLTSNTPNLEVMDHTQKLPNPSMSKLEILSPPFTIRGSWDTSQILGRRIDDFRNSVDSRIPVVIDAGRIFFSSPMLSLIRPEATVGIVIREGYLPALPVLNYVKDLTTEAGANAGIISIGKPIWSNKEYYENTGLNVLGWLPENSKNFVDLNGFNGTKGISSKFIKSARNLADNLYEQAA